jgi:hypothetical protein
MRARYSFVFILLFLSLSLNAGTAPTATARCKVINSNNKFAILNCDPETKINLKTPRNWFAEAVKLTKGEMVELQLNQQQLKSWTLFNEKTTNEKTTKTRRSIR